MDQQDIKWVKPALNKKALKGLTARRDRPALWHLSLQLLITAGLGWAAYYSFNNASLLIGLPVLYLYFIAYSWLGREGLFHELAHRTVFARKGVNDFFYKFVNIIGWMNGEYVRVTHMNHHKVTMYEEWDMDVALILDFGKSEVFYALIFHFRHFFRDVMRLWRCAFGKLTTPYDLGLFPEENKKSRKRLKRDSWIVLGTQTGLLLFFALTGEWLLILMVCFGSFFATWAHLLPSMTQHVGMRRNVNDFRLSSRTVKMDRITRFFYWDMGFHIEHHLYPSVPYYNLKKLRTEVREFLPDSHAGLRSVWKDILFFLKRRQTDPGYFCPVRLP